MSDDENTDDYAEESSRPAEAQAPLLRVITPGATPEEVAALVAVVASLGQGEEAPPAPKPVWSAPARLHRTTYPSGPGAWRASGLPR